MVAAATVVRWWRQHRHTALPLAASQLLGSGPMQIVKTLVGCMRPGLRPSASCSGFSFPSDHTFAVAATTNTTTTATAIVFARLWTRSHSWAVNAAFAWAALMALSRLVPGVHGPADVLAAASIGAAIPLPLSLGLAPKRHCYGFAV